MDIDKAHYMQNPFDTLTKEKLDRLEKHCKKAIHFERGYIQEEHQTILDLLYKYQEQQTQLEKKDIIINYLIDDLYDLAVAINEEYHVEEFLLNKETIKEYYLNRKEE